MAKGYKGKAPTGTVSVSSIGGRKISYAAEQKTIAQSNISSSAYIERRKTFTEAKTLAQTNDGGNRHPFKTQVVDNQGDTITGESLIKFDRSFLGHDGKYLQLYPSSSDGSSKEYTKFTMVNESYNWNFTFDSAKLPNMVRLKNVNSPTISTIVTGADGYVQNFAFVGSGKTAIAWNSSDVINDTASTHYYTSQDNIRVSAVKSGNLWFCARALVWFDTSSIPSGKTIKKAKVRLKLKQHVVTQTDYGEILKIYEWDEFAPSGRITTTDFDGFDIEGGTVDMTNVANGDWIEFDITGDLLSNFQSNYSAASPNQGYGFMIRNRYDFDGASLTPTGFNYHWFHSADTNSIPSQRPELVVSYE